MPRMVFGILTTLSLLLTATLCAQRSFPSPSIQLHDENFRAPKLSHPEPPRFVITGAHPFVLRSTATTINSLAFSQDGKLLAAGKNYGRLVVWDVASQKVARLIDTGFANVGRIAFSPDNGFIAAAATSGPTVKVWRLLDGQLTATLDNTRANVLELMYLRDSHRLIVFSGPTEVFDAESGKVIVSFPDDRDPLISSDGSTLLTMAGAQLVLRNTADWAIEQTLPKLTQSERPVFLDAKQGMFLFEDMSDDHVFVAARTSDGQLLPGVKLANLPKAWLSFDDDAAIDPHTGLIFGHSAGQLWALDLKTGKTCLSAQLWSSSGALSPDGNLLAGAYEPQTATDDQKQGGVELWKTSDLAKACHMQ